MRNYVIGSQLQVSNLRGGHSSPLVTSRQKRDLQVPLDPDTWESRLPPWFSALSRCESPGSPSTDQPPLSNAVRGVSLTSPGDADAASPGTMLWGQPAPLS